MLHVPNIFFNFFVGSHMYAKSTFSALCILILFFFSIFFVGSHMYAKSTFSALCILVFLFFPFFFVGGHMYPSFLKNGIHNSYFFTQDKFLYAIFIFLKCIMYPIFCTKQKIHLYVHCFVRLSNFFHHNKKILQNIYFFNE